VCVRAKTKKIYLSKVDVTWYVYVRGVHEIGSLVGLGIGIMTWE